MFVTTNLINERELGYLKQPKVTLDSVVEKFECQRLDEHFIEGRDNGGLIPPLACSFSKAAVSPREVLAVSDEDGGVVLFNTHKIGHDAIASEWLAHTNAVFDLDWMPDEGFLLTASGDQTIALWDVATEKRLSVFGGHTSSVKTVRFRQGDKDVFASGSRDGHIMIWDKRVRTKDGKVPSVNTIRNAHSCTNQTPSGRRRRSSTSKVDSQQSVTAVLFQDDFTLVSTGSVDGSVKVWDMRKNYTSWKSEAVPKYNFPYSGNSIRSHGFSSLAFDSTRTRLFANCMDHIIYQYDCASFQPDPVATYRGHRNTTFYIRSCISPDDQYLLSGSSDNSAWMWRIPSSGSVPLVLRGHSSEVSSVAWSPHSLTSCVTLSDDGTMRIWRRTVSEKKAEPGTIVGYCERPHREIGVTASTGVSSKSTMAQSPQIRNILISPIRGTAVPSSPAKVSFAVRQSLAAMNTVSKSPLRLGECIPSPRLVSPSITKWFQKQNMSIASPRKLTSPRRLVVTPKKTSFPISTSSTQHAVSPGVVCDHTRVCTAKRKLDNSADDSIERKPKRARKCSQDDSGDECLERRSKRARICSQDENLYAKGKLSSSSPCNGKVLVSYNKPQTPKLETVKKSLFEDGLTAKTRVEASKTFESPTMNLPNYVVNPQPRTPVGKVQHPLTPDNTPDWLTRIRLGRDSTGSPSETRSPRSRTPHNKEPKTPCETATATTPSSRKRKRKAEDTQLMRTPSQRNKTNQQTTPISRGKDTTPRTLRRSRSILQYFSPRDGQEQKKEH